MTNILKLISNKISIASTVVLMFFVFGILLGSFLNKTQSVGIESSDDCSPDFMFVRVEHDCKSFKTNVDKIQKIQDELKRQINNYFVSNRADRVSVFVRDLTSQRFAIVNESEEFFMASLLKVPLAIAYYRLAELTPDLLTQKITYDGKVDLYSLQVVAPKEKLIVGKTYSVQDLLHRALIYSDNTAAQILSENYVSYDYLQKILFTLGLQPKAKDQRENLVTARSFASVFRSLYNASFLSRRYSDEILTDLSKSEFTDVVTADLPKNISVSHKFGERSFVDAGRQVTKRQLHDCGVVYANNGTMPYSFCIMTEGENMDDLKSIIKNISGAIYKGIVE